MFICVAQTSAMSENLRFQTVTNPDLFQTISVRCKIFSVISRYGLNSDAVAKFSSFCRDITEQHVRLTSWCRRHFYELGFLDHSNTWHESSTFNFCCRKIFSLQSSHFPFSLYIMTLPIYPNFWMRSLHEGGQSIVIYLVVM